MDEVEVVVPASLLAFGRWQREGDAGRAWLEGLPAAVSSRCEQWGLRLDGTDVRHGTNGLAVPVRRGDEPLVLKLDWPGAEAAAQERALRAWDGRGAVLLHRADAGAGVLLLERLDATLTLRDLPLLDAVPAIGGVLRRLALPTSEAFASTADEARARAETFRPRWAEVGRPFDERLLGRAVALADDVAGTAAAPVLFDRDLSYEDVIRGVREPWLVVDPLPMVGDLELQVAQLLWLRHDEMVADGRVRWSFDALVEAAGLDHDRARAWLVLRCVDYWLWGLANGLTQDPLRCAAIVDELA